MAQMAINELELSMLLLFCEDAHRCNKVLKDWLKKTQSESMSAVNAKQVKVTGRLKRIVGFPVRCKEILVSSHFLYRKLHQKYEEN